MKVLKNKNRRKRFEREVSTMKRLTQAGVDVVPPVVESGTHQERPYYVIPWYEESLQDCVEDGRLKRDPLTGLDLLVELAAAIQAIHDSEVAHRDLKPGNVLRDGSRVYLADFGLCLDVDSQDRLTATDEAVGSRLYIAPENEQGLNEDVDQRPADFYAFGKIAWALLAGREPPPRERLLDDQWRLDLLGGDPRLAALNPLLARLVEPHPPSRLLGWNRVRAELASVRDVLAGRSTSLSVAASREALDNAGQIPHLPSVRAVLEGRSSAEQRDQRLREWREKVAVQAIGAAKPLEDKLESLTSATDRVLIFGFNDHFVGLTHSQDRRYLPTPDSYTSLNTGALVDFHVMAIEEIYPAFHVSVYFRERDSSEIWVARLPLLKRGAVVEVPEWLLEEVAQTVGPMPLFLNSTLDQILDVVQEAGRLFLGLCERYLAILTSGSDLNDSSAWKT